MQKQTREHKKKGKAVKIGYGKITIENTLRVWDNESGELALGKK